MNTQKEKKNKAVRAVEKTLKNIDFKAMDERIIRKLSKIPSYKHPIIPWANRKGKT